MQEAQEKINKIGDKQKKWHFIGHLQKNKARFAVELFDCIHSVDTPGLAREINRRTDRTMDVLIQVNISGEKTKHGTTPEGALEIARLMPELKKLNLRGLMTIPPPVDTPERSRPYFITLRRLAERINRERIPGVVLHDLSMGMSSDFDIAVEEGATMVRVGTAIFGPREPAPEKGPAKKPASAPKKAAVTKESKPPIKKKTAVTKPDTQKKSALNTKKTASVTKKAAAKKTKDIKKEEPRAKKKAAKVNAVKAKKKAPQKAAVTKTKKAAIPETAKKTTLKQKTAPGAKKKSLSAKAAAKKAAPAIAGKKTAKKAAASKKSPVSKAGTKKTKKPSSAKKKSS